MCIIIERKPGFQIPEQKLENAIINNPDGYGICFPAGDNRLTVYRDVSKPEPEMLATTLNEHLKNEQILLHLRYNTAGSTILRNAHPFPVLERSKDGLDIRMAHNGTIHSFKPSKDINSSDTRLFVRDVVRPLFKRFSKAMEPEELLNDPVIARILKEMIPSSSVLVFMDGTGQVKTINELGNGGKREDQWYYSNTYSFNPRHRLPAVDDSDRWYSYGKGSSYSPPATKNKQTPYFSEKYDLDQGDLMLLSDESIKEVVSKRPKDAELLIKELINIQYEMTKRNEALKASVKALTEKKEKSSAQ